MTQKQDLRERCSYLLILFKAKDKALFEKYTAELAKINAEASEEFYHYLLAEYKKLVEGPTFSRPQMPIANVSVPKAVVEKKEKPKKKAALKKPAAKKVVVKKKPAKKVTKKVAKKVAKKVTKKVVKKKKKSKKQ